MSRKEHKKLVKKLEILEKKLITNEQKMAKTAKEQEKNLTRAHAELEMIEVHEELLKQKIQETKV